MRGVSILFAFIFLACGTQKLSDYKEDSIAVDSTAGDGGLEEVISPYRDSMDQQMQEVIATAQVSLEKDKPESPLGNFAAEAVYKEGLKIGQNSRALGPNIMKRSFALLNFGGLRAPINQGAVTIGNIYELMPFDNTLVLVKLSGDAAREMCRYLFESYGQPIYNASFKLTEEGEQMKIGGEPYHFDEDIVVVTSDYLANGGDKMDFFNDPVMKYDSGRFLRDVFIDYVKETRNLGKYELTGKFEIING